MLRRLLSALLALLVLPLSAGPALAIGTLDQEVLPEGGCSAPFIQQFQTFTAGLTGGLDTVAFHGLQIIPGNWNVAVYAVSAGEPSGPVLGSGSAPWVVDVWDWISVPLDPIPEVTAGTQYALAVTPDLGTFGSCWSEGAAYAGGAYSGGPNRAFRTFVTVAPVPPVQITHLVVTSRVSATQDGAGSESLTVLAGATVYRTVTIANGGTTMLAGLTVTDSGPGGALPASCPALPASLAVGGSYTCTFSQVAAAGTTAYTTTAVAGGQTALGAVFVTGTVPATTPTIGSKLGLPTDAGAYTGSTKVASLNGYVTWQADFGSVGAGKTIGVHVATKGTDGSWGPFARLTSRLADASGVARFRWRQTDAAWLSVRFSLDASGMTPAAQARWR